MKTNRDIFMETFIEELKESNTERFVELISAFGSFRRCGKCSNSYWDGNHYKCHKNINKSDCQKGQMEYFESYPGDDLQKKYNKQYWYCNGYEQAQALNKLTELLYSYKVVLWNGTEICKGCANKGKKCYEFHFKCYVPFQYLMDSYSDYVKEKIKDLDEFDEFNFRNEITFEIWLRDIIIASISNKGVLDKAKSLYELAYIQK